MKWKLALLITAALVLAACGSVAENIAEEAIERGLESEGGGNVEVDIDDDGEGSIEIQSDEGDAVVSFGGGELPDGLPMPIADGYTVLGSTNLTSGDQTIVTATLEYPPSALDDLVELYEDYFAEFDEVFTAHSDQSDSKLWNWGTNDGGQSVAISAYEGDDYVTVAVTKSG